MEFGELHSWKLTPAEAIKLQAGLREKVRAAGSPADVKLVAGADVSFDRRTGRIFAAVVNMSYPGLETVEKIVATMEATFPYIPGLLSFREGPVLLKAFGRLREKPDLIFFDGQGVAHPRRLGLASHLGLFLEIPSIGCAKSRLIGDYEEPATEKGSQSSLHIGEEIIGTVLRTRRGVKSLFVSVGHLISLESAVDFTLSACRKYRLPETVRAAHNLAAEIKREIRGAA